MLTDGSLVLKHCSCIEGSQVSVVLHLVPSLKIRVQSFAIVILLFKGFFYS